MNYYDLVQVSEWDERSKKASQLFFDEDLSKKFLTLFHIGDKYINLYGNPLVMMRWSDLFAQFTDSLFTLKTEPLHLSRDTVITDDNLFGLLRVWLYMNGMIM